MVLFHVCEGDDICDAIRVVPYPPITGELSHCVDDRLPDVCPNGYEPTNGVDIDKELGVAEHVDRRLVVQQDPKAV